MFNFSTYFSEFSLCVNSTANVIINTSFNVTRAVLLLPLCIFILCAGFQRRRKRRSDAVHCDVFTYHQVALELIWAFALLLSLCSSSTHFQQHIIFIVVCLYSLTWYGENCFHILTCVERYVAVVHPITYMSHKNGSGVKIRNFSIGCAWLSCVAWVAASNVYMDDSFIISVVCPVVVSLAVVTFCSVSVLCVLHRPGPGEGVKNKKPHDQAKQRAFFTILAVTGALWLWFVGNLVSYTLRPSPLLSHDAGCLVAVCSLWFNLPSSLVLPVLYLQRAGWLSCF